MTLTNPGVSQLSIRGDGKLLASAGWDHRVRVFGWKKLRPLAVLQYHRDMVLSVAFSDHKDPRQRLLAAGSKDQRISLWSIYNEVPDTGWPSECYANANAQWKGWMQERRPQAPCLPQGPHESHVIKITHQCWILWLLKDVQEVLLSKCCTLILICLLNHCQKSWNWYTNGCHELIIITYRYNLRKVSSVYQLVAFHISQHARNSSQFPSLGTRLKIKWRWTKGGLCP